MAGRRPAPPETRAAKGTTKKRPNKVDIPPRQDGLPTPPVWLAKAERTAWGTFSNLLHARGQLSPDSTPSLIALCAVFVEWIELRDDLRENGRFQRVLTVAGAEKDEPESEDYMERPRPALAAFQDADRRLKGWLIEFGLTDASRGKVQTKSPSTEDDPLSKYGLN